MMSPKNTYVPRVLVSHVGVAPFVQQVARAFNEKNALARLVTTVVDRPRSVLQKVACAAAQAVHFDLAGQMRRRAVREVPDRLVADRPWAELVRLGVGRLDRSGVLTDLAHEWMETGFDRWVARTQLRTADIVYSYENVCAASFRAARARGLFRVYDAPAPEYRFSQAILDAELGLDPALNSAYQKHIRAPHRERRRDGRRQSEYARANLIVTASSVTRDSFADYFRARGRDAEINKIVTVPYGAPAPDPTGADGGSRANGPVRLLWAGSFSVRKGARYLLQAWRRLAPSTEAAVLDVYGAVTVPPALLSGLPDSVRFHGSVSRDQLLKVYKDTDLLVFPTLCDGFGMVVTEALSRGLPVLTTTRAGAADLIRNGSNGFLVPAADADALAAALERTLSRRNELPAMRPPALEAAARWQWADYRRELARVVFERYRAWRGSR